MRVPTFTDLLIKELYDFLARWEKLIPLLNEQGREVHEMVIRLAKGQLKAIRIYLDSKRSFPVKSEVAQEAIQAHRITDRALFETNFGGQSSERRR